jgi:hypothetical protein
LLDEQCVRVVIVSNRLAIKLSYHGIREFVNVKTVWIKD